MSLKFEQTVFEIFGNVVRYLKAQPLNLGGYMASGGGAGGPPGGFIGQLPQTRVSYDLTEAATLAVPFSGASLIDNLNHIRYRLGTVEGSGNMGVDVYEDGVVIAEGIHVVDFINHFDVETSGADGVTVALLSSGVLSDVTYSGVYGENLTPYINGVNSHFDLLGTVNDNSLEVYFNGIRQSTSEYTLDGDYQGFTTTFVPLVDDTLQVDYIEAYTGAFHTHSQYASASGVMTVEQVLALIATKANLAHYHTVSDITDLPDPLTINQQIVFTIASSGYLTSGVKPLRIYAHDVNDHATISEIFVCFNTPPATTAVRMNVLKNGSTIFNAPTYVTVASGAYTGSKTTGFLDDTFVKDDYFQIKVEQGDNAASDMTLHIRFSYELD